MAPSSSNMDQIDYKTEVNGVITELYESIFSNVNLIIGSHFSFFWIAFCIISHYMSHNSAIP